MDKMELTEHTQTPREQPKEFMGRNAEIANKIHTLRRRMRCTNFWLHLVRNNPRHRDRYYFELISIVGYENWSKVNDIIRMNWESARLSFDKMYGMVKSFAEHIDVYSSVFGFEMPDMTKPDEFQDMKNNIDSFNRNMQNFNENMQNFKSLYDKFRKKLDELDQFQNIKGELISCRDSLNELIPSTDHE